MTRAGTRMIAGMKEAVAFARDENVIVRVHAPERKPVPAATFVLPMPISTNELWMPVRRGNSAALIRSAAYKNWLEEAGHILNRQAKERVIGAYAMMLTVSRKSRCDLGNAEKAVSDLLQHHGIIENDRHCTRQEVVWGDVDGMHVQLIASKPKHGEAA